MTFDGNEVVGYVASALVVLSLAMTSVVRLRTISLAGSVAFVAYGVLIDAVPIVVTNLAIAVLNVWFLTRELGGRRDLGAVIVPADSPFLADFLKHHDRDIRRFQPDVELPPPADDATFALVLTRDGLPAGAVLGRREETTLHLQLDYVLKAYRDSRLGRWLFGPGASVLRHAGIDRVTSTSGGEVHRGYLQRVGFEHDPESGRWTRSL